MKPKIRLIFMSFYPLLRGLNVLQIHYFFFRKYIESYEKDYRLSAEISFQLSSFSNEAIAEAFESVYKSQRESFRISISFSSILINKETCILLGTCDRDFRIMK